MANVGIVIHCIGLMMLASIAGSIDSNQTQGNIFNEL
jgi:hypothetical protein